VPVLVPVRFAERYNAVAERNSVGDGRDPFRVAIVCMMWMTDFDVPFLASLYPDKPLEAEHTDQTFDLRISKSARLAASSADPLARWRESRILVEDGAVRRETCLLISQLAHAEPCHHRQRKQHRTSEFANEICGVCSRRGNAIKEHLNGRIVRRVHDRRGPHAAGLQSQPSQYNCGKHDHRCEASNLVSFRRAFSPVALEEGRKMPECPHNTASDGSLLWTHPVRQLGNENPRHPISSPKALIMEGTSETTVMNPKAAAMTSQSGWLGRCRVKRARGINVSRGIPPSPVTQTIP
jgi:hypothetical protein